MTFMPLKRPERKHILLLAAIIVFGVFLRLYNFGSYPFGFDQVQILENAHKIAGGHPTLIGPRTGPGEMFTGPLIYYLTGFNYLFFQNHMSLFLTSAAFFILTGITLAYLAQKYLNQFLKTVSALLIWAFSPYLVALDRITWNPNLTLLAGFLSFFPLLELPYRRAKHADLLFLFLGSFLGYQAHFSGILLPVLVCLIWLFFIRKQIIIVIASLLGLLVSLIPTLIFDIRHGWLNLHGFLKLFENQVSAENYLWLNRLIHNLYITVENQGKLLSFHHSSLVIIAIGCLILLVYGIVWGKQSKTKHRLHLIIPLIWIVIIAFAYSFYSAGTPEYYYLIQTPALIVIIVELIYFFSFQRLWLFSMLVVPFLLISLRADYVLVTETGKLNLRDQVATSRYLHYLSGFEPVSQFRYQMPHADNLGLEYLLSDIPLNSQGSAITIIFPTQTYEVYSRQFGLIGILKE